MSFGGGREQYTLEYIVKIVNQGGGGALNQINQGFTKTGQTAANATVSTEKLAAASNRLQQANMGLTKSAKSVAFGMFGITTAGAEMFGMLSMLQQVQLAQKEALEEQATALKEGGKESKAYKDATMEVVKVNRWASMTQRNFMLSIFDMIPFTIMAVHGLTKMTTAMKEVKAARAAAADLKLLGFNASGVAANMLKAGTSIGGFTPQISKFSKATTIATTGTFKLGAETVKTTKFFGAGEAALISNAVALGKAEKAATSTSKAMRVLGIAMKVAIPLIALEVGAQAFANNWGGFRDKINEVGKAIGDTIPQLKGFLGLVDKVGRSVVAIFTGDFESIGSIWNPVVEGGDEAVKVTEKMQKQIDETREAMLDFRNESSSFFSELAAADKGERKDLLKAMGLSKDSRGDLKDTLEMVEQMDETLMGFHNSVKSMEAINILQKFGIDVPNDAWKDMAKGLAKEFKELGRTIPGDDMFEEFAKVMKKASKQKGPAVVTAIMEFSKTHPDFMPFLAQWNPDLAADLTTMLNNAALDANKQIGGAQGLMGAIMGTSPRTETVNKKFGEMDIPGSGGDAGIFQPIIDKLKEGIKAVPNAIKALDWNAIGKAIGDSLEQTITPANAKRIGQLIRIYIVDPAYAAAYPIGSMIGAGIRQGMADFQKDPLGSIGGTANMIGEPIGEFVAGLLGYESEADMYKIWRGKLNTISMNFWAMVRQELNNQETQKTATGSGGMDMGQGVWFENWLKGFQEGYIKFIAEVQNNTYVKALASWIHDPWGSLINFIKNVMKNVEAAAAKEKQSGVDLVYTPGEFWTNIGGDKFLKDIGTEYTNLVTKISSDPNVVKFKGFLDAAVKGGQAVLDYIWNLGGQGVQTASGSGISDELINAAGGFNAAEGGIKFQIPTVEIIPGQIILGGGIQGGTNSTPIIEGPNGVTPSFTTPSAIITPVSATVDISGVTPTISNVTDNGGRDSTGHPGTWGGVYALYIDYPGTVGIKPQSVAFDISESDVAVGVTTFQAIAVEADKTKQFIINAYNELAATLAELFSTISGLWSDASADIGQNAADTRTAIENEYGEGLQNVYDTMVDLGQQWSEISAEIAQNAADASQGILNEFEEAAEGVMDKFDEMQDHWDDVTDNMVKLAANAADEIQNEMDSIKDTESTHTIRTIRVGSVATGGQISLAQGGIISAASGRMLTTRGPTYLIGDNPGGTESIWAIPHNNPAPTIQKIDRMYGAGGAGGSGSSTWNQKITVHVKGSDLVNDTKIEKKIRTTIGDKRDRFGGV